MGANSYRTVALGPSAREAFSRAVEDAAYEYGHGGYTGTIAEKGGYGFVLVSLPARWKADDFADAIFDAAYDDPTRGSEPWQVKARLRAKRLANALPATEIKRLADLANDKWGPAIGVELHGAAAAEVKARHGRKGTRDLVFVFFGTASS